MQYLAKTDYCYFVYYLNNYIKQGITVGKIQKKLYLIEYFFQNDQGILIEHYGH